MKGLVNFWMIIMGIIWSAVLLVLTIITLALYPFACLFTLCSRKRLEWSWFNAKIISMLSIIFLNGRVTVKGKENIPDFSKGKYCVVANHQSLLDITALIAYCKIKAGFVTKAELRFVPIINIWLLLLHCVLLKRGSVKNTIVAMQKSVQLIDKGYQMVIFPEGTRSKTDEVKEFHPGSFKLAYRSKSNILPIVIRGTRACAEGSSNIYPKKITISILKPVSTENLTSEEKLQLPHIIQKQVSEEYEKIKVNDANR